MADIFLSYKKEDRRHAERTAGALGAAGWSVWWDDGLTPHEAWDRTIEKEIAQAAAVVVLWTRRSVVSDWVRSEAHYALSHGKLLPAIIEPCEIPLAFTLRQALDLSKSRFDRSDPEWCKFLKWVEELVGRADQASTVETKQPPVRRMRLGHRALATGAGLSVAVVGVLAWLIGMLAPTPARPEVVVDDFTVSGGVPPSFAADLKDEMLTSFSASSILQPKQGDGTRHRKAYQVSGRVDSDSNVVRVYLKVFAPGSDAPVLTTSVERPATQRMAARAMAFDLAMAVRCITTASDSSGSATTVLPKQAIAPWAQFCNQTEIEQSDPNEAIASLRRVTLAAPKFANGWSNLADQEFAASIEPDTDRAALRTDARRSIERALELDPRSAKALMVKAWLTVGNGGPDTGPSLFPHYQNFAEFDRLVTKATTVRPSDCGCELIQRGFLLRQMGQPSASLVYFKRGAQGQTGSYEAEMLQAEALASIGRGAEAERIYAKLLETWPDVPRIRQLRLNNAMWRGDWSLARTLSNAAHDEAVGPARDLLIDAMQKGNSAERQNAITMLRHLVANQQTLNADSISLLAFAGDSDGAIAALRRWLVTTPPPLSFIIFEPTFAGARRSPAFAQLVKDMNLVEYWRLPGHRPDFCSTGSAPALCHQLS